MGYCFRFQQLRRFGIGRFLELRKNGDNDTPDLDTREH